MDVLIARVTLSSVGICSGVRFLQGRESPCSVQTIESITGSDFQTRRKLITESRNKNQLFKIGIFLILQMFFVFSRYLSHGSTQKPQLLKLGVCKTKENGFEV